jgi:hypothetical protein
VSSEVPTATDPDIITILDVGKESVETPDPTGVAEDPSMHSHRHHPRVQFGLRNELIKGIDEEFPESPPRHQGATY